MIRIAAGETLPFGQDEVRQTGWAIEARVYAEDPLRNFLPSIGRLVRYRPPEGDGIRIDTGVFEGAEITIHYDPMIAKLVAYAADRDRGDRPAARRRSTRFYIAGVQHNIAFLAAIAASDRFRRGALSTDFIAEEFPDGFGAPGRLTAADRRDPDRRGARRDAAARSEIAGNGADAKTCVVPPRCSVCCLTAIRAVFRSRPRASAYRVERDGESWLAATDWRPGNPLMHLRVEDRLVAVQIERLRGRGFRLVHRRRRSGAPRCCRRAPPSCCRKCRRKQPADTSRLVLSPMPGLLTQLVVGEGQEVKAGEPLAIVEAMKMENVLRAERDGRIAKLRAKPGDSLAVDQVILELE